MTTSTHSYHGYELGLHHDNDHYRVMIFDPKGNRVASTGTHLERQGAITEASRYINQLLAKGVRTAQVRNQPARDVMAFKPNYGRDRADRARAARARSEEKSERETRKLRCAKPSAPKLSRRLMKPIAVQQTAHQFRSVWSSSRVAHGL